MCSSIVLDCSYRIRKMNVKKERWFYKDSPIWDLKALLSKNKGGLNMSTALFVAGSYFQLIMCANLRTSVYKDWDADIVIYHTTVHGAEHETEIIAERLRKVVRQKLLKMHF